MLSGSSIDVGTLVVSGKIMMQQPRLAGFTRDNRRYDMVAQAAAQDLTKPDMVELHGVQATMEMKDTSVFETTAKGGLYNTKTEQLTLSQNIVVTSSSGYQAFLNEAVLDVKAGKILSDKPMEVKTATWTINANRMEVAESGDLLQFVVACVSVVLSLDSSTRRGRRACHGRGLASHGAEVAGAAAMAAALTLGAADAAAQQQKNAQPQPQPQQQKNQGPPNALQGFSQNRDEPVKIRAASLEVREKDKMATFTGDVHVLQGDTELRANARRLLRGGDTPQPSQQANARPVKAAEPGRAAIGKSAGSKPRATWSWSRRTRTRPGCGDVQHAREHRDARRQRGGDAGSRCAARSTAGGRSHQRRIEDGPGSGRGTVPTRAAREEMRLRRPGPAWLGRRRRRNTTTE